MQWQNQPRKIIEPVESIALAEFIGILAGDGHLSTYQVTMSTNSETDVQHAQYVAGLGARLFGVLPSITRRSERKVMVVVFSSKAMASFLVTKGLLIGNKVTQRLRMPKWIADNSAYSAAFLRGLFDTDGSVFLDKHRIKHRMYAHLGWQFTSAIPELLLDISSFLQERGFRFSSSPLRRNIHIRRRADVERYFQEIGSHNDKHLSRLAAFKEQIRRGG